MLLESIDRQPDIAANIPVAVSATDPDLCTQSYACVKACPAGARCPDDATGAVVLDVRLCVGCGICVDVCPSAACSLEEATAEIYLPELQDGDSDE